MDDDDVTLAHFPVHREEELRRIVWMESAPLDPLEEDTEPEPG